MPVDEREPPVPLTSETFGAVAAVLGLDLSVAALSSHLPDRLHQEEAAVHARMGVGQAAAGSVQGEVAARGGALIGNKVGSLAGSTEAKPSRDSMTV